MTARRTAPPPPTPAPSATITVDACVKLSLTDTPCTVGHLDALLREARAQGATAESLVSSNLGYYRSLDFTFTATREPDWRYVSVALSVPLATLGLEQ